MSQAPVAACLSEYCRRPERTPREAEVGWFCSPCVDHTRSSLLDLASLHPRLDCAAIPQRGLGGGRAKGGHSDLAVNLQAAETHGRTMFWANKWRDIVCDERDMCGPRDRTPPGVLRWLAAYHLDWFATHPSSEVACELVDEAANLFRAARAALEPPPRRVKVGMRCLGYDTGPDGDRSYCQGELVARLSEESSTYLVCTLNRRHRVALAAYARGSVSGAA